MSRHPVTIQIDDAIDQLEKYGLPVTPDVVKDHVKQNLTWADYSPDEAADDGLSQRIPRRMRDRGYVISDAEMHVRKDFSQATISDLEEQIRIKEESSTYDRNRILADKAVVTFLKEKQKEFGYEVYVGLFHAEVDRIYAMHSLTAPGAREKNGQVA